MSKTNNEEFKQQFKDSFYSEKLPKMTLEQIMKTEQAVINFITK